MAVTEAFTLPAPPTTGSVEYLPLGGDGFSAPFAAYNVINAQVSGDASAGRASITCNMDSRYCALVAYASVAIEQGTSADADVKVFLAGESFAEQTFQAPVESISATIASRTVTKTWNPTPFVLPGARLQDATQPRLDFRALNVDGDEFFLSALIYLFNVRVRELTPMGPLLWARGAT